MRRNILEITNGEINPDGPYQNVISTNNLVYVYNDSGTLRIKWMDIKTPGHKDAETIITNGTQSYSLASIWVGVDNSDRWIAMERIAGRIIVAFWTGTTGSHTLHYLISTDNGQSWTHTEAQSGDDSYQIATNQQIFNVTFIDSVPYAVVYAQATPRLTIYNLSTFNSVLTSDFRYTSGHFNEDDDDYKLVQIEVDGSDYQIRLFEFNGSTLTETEEIDITNTVVINANEMHLSYCVRKFVGDSLFLFIKANASVLCYVRPGDGILTPSWYQNTFSGTPAIHLSWNDYSYMDLNYFHLSGDIDSIYRLSDKGYILKITHEATETVNHGIRWWMYPYNFEQSDDENLYESMIHEKHLEASRLSLRSSNINDFQRGDGITVFDSGDLDGEIFYGEVSEFQNDLESQYIEFIEPSINDLDKEISVSFVSKTVSYILTYILINFCIFLFPGAIDSTSDTYTIEWKNIPIKQILKWLEEREYKIIHWLPRGYVLFNDGDQEYESFLEASGDTGEILTNNLGKNFNAVLLRGGLKIDGSNVLARLLRIDPNSNAPQLNIFTIDVPQMTDDEDAVGHEMYEYGNKILANRNDAFTSLAFGFFEHVKPQIGAGDTVTSPTYGIDGKYILYEFIFYPEELSGEIIQAYSGLFNQIDSEESLPQSNREVIGQMASGKVNRAGDTISGTLIIEGNLDVQGLLFNSTGDLHINDSVDIDFNLNVDGYAVLATKLQIQQFDTEGVIINQSGGLNHSIYIRRGYGSVGGSIENVMEFHEYGTISFYTNGAIASQTEKFKIGTTYSSFYTKIDMDNNYLFDLGRVYSNVFTANGTFMNVLGGNYDVKIWQVDASVVSETPSNTFGFYLQYNGTGTGINNSLSLYAHNQSGADIEVYEIDQSGNIKIKYGLLGTLQGTKFIIQGSTPGEALEFYQSGTESVGNKYINQVIDGTLIIRGFHGLQLGTNDGGVITTINILPASVAIAQLVTITKSTNASFKGLEIFNLNSGTSARATLEVSAQGGGIYLMATSAGYTAVAGWADMAILGKDSGLDGGLLIYTSGDKFLIQSTAGTNLLKMEATGHWKFYSAEAGKTDYRFNINTADADNISLYVYEESPATHRALRLGSSSGTTHILIDPPNNKIEFTTGSIERFQIGSTMYSYGSLQVRNATLSVYDTTYSRGVGFTFITGQCYLGISTATDIHVYKYGTWDGWKGMEGDYFTEHCAELSINLGLGNVLNMRFNGLNWKESFPEPIIKRTIVNEFKPLTEEEINLGVIPLKIGEHEDIGINIGMEARLALKSIQELHTIIVSQDQKIKNLEAIVGT